ncbi:hypothetical protein CDO52_03455 [Nocardiopsis gilva YIM 90087]|uniref:DUF418 domain-containing protein n=1 Tax=Nocardiopsis gilva YIM 90087 TaxID=1235441 RepID=A0A223S1G5_9ACTN|nr:DUF418 domain-containing protein [Nocardiopsis gilva]ASU81961.1 hypothetical protein CDO52_03455 [Nocardiopsis gilva YIM 90087]
MTDTPAAERIPAPGPAQRHRPTPGGRRAALGRLLGVDAVRALAIFGMVWMHFVPTGWLEPTPLGQDWPTILQWLNQFTDTRARSLFFLLAGVSVALMTGGAAPLAGREMRAARMRIAVRAAVLFLLGLCLAEMSGAANIITAYTGWLLFLLPWTALRTRTLFGAAGVFAVASPVFKIASMNWGQDWGFMPAFGPGAPQPAEGLSLLLAPGDWLTVFQNYVFGADTIYALPLLLAGLAIGRLDLRDHAVRVRMAVTGLGLAAGAWAVSWILLAPLGLGAAIDRYQEAMAVPPPPAADGALQMPLVPWAELVALSWPGPGIPQFSVVEIAWMVGVALALLGGLLILMDRAVWRRALWPLAAAGSMALTWYFVQDVIGHRLMSAGAAGGGHDPQSMVPYVLFVVAVLALSAAWRYFFRRGPLEALVHRAITWAVPRRAH